MLRAVPLTAEAFAPFGAVLVPPAGAGRDYFDASLSNGRAQARPSVSLATIDEAAALPLDARQMERHPFSSQTFVPMTDAPYLVCVAPHDAHGRPDMGRASAFVARGVGITYAADTWHHPMTVLEAPARFTVVMWLDDSDGDTEFTDIEPVRIAAD